VARVAKSTTDTVPELKFATYARPAAGSAAISPGPLPTAIEPVTVFVAVSITDTADPPLFAT
jgi:hypothetical protein